MTATKPVLFRSEDKRSLISTELISDYSYYYKRFNRTKLMPRLSKIELDEFTTIINSIINDNTSCMIVCNTIQSSLEIYHKLKKMRPARMFYYLSTNLVPAQRRQRIMEINKALKTDQKPILIATQVVEAGADLDFDIVIRDFAPLDSIIQCAGRCNRNGLQWSNGKGEVYVFNVVNANKKPYSSYIYGTTNLKITCELFEKEHCIEEKDYLELIEAYYSKVQENISCQVALDLIDSIEEFDMSNEGIGGFSIIKNNPGYIDVLFRLNQDVENAYQEFLKALRTEDLQKKRVEIQRIKPILDAYTISMPKKYIINFDIFNAGENYKIITLPIEGADQYYDNETGFKRTEQENALIF